MRFVWLPRLTLVLVLVVLALFLPPASAAQVRGEAPAGAYVPGEVVIGWQPGEGPVPHMPVEPERMGTDREDPQWQAAAATINRATGLSVLGTMPEHGIARLSVPAGSESAEIERLETLPWVRYAELNYLAYAAESGQAEPVYPNDPDFPRQWNMHRVKAPEAWSMTRGSLSFVVAVLDTGVATRHPDLAGQLVDSQLWFNYVTNAPGAEDDDPESHGTHVTGILAARMNNAQGVAGLAPDIRILPLKVLRSDQSGRFDAIAAAIYDAADLGAQVINLSLVSTSWSQLLQDAVAYAQAPPRGALVVAAAGNDGLANPTIYPAAFPGVLAVSASDRFDRATTYTGHTSYIGIAAPGGTSDEPIWSTANGESAPWHFWYRYLYGTSMSTPLVSAAAALVWTLQPGARAGDIADILKGTADKVGTDPFARPLSYDGGRNDYFGAGRLNVANAVRAAYPPSLAAATGQVEFLLGGAVTSATRSVEITNLSGRAVYWQASILSGSPWLTLSTPAGTSSYGSPAPAILRVNRTNLAPGTYYGGILVQPIDPPGIAPVEVRVVLRVAATLSHTFVPLVTQGIRSAWLDPDAPGSLYRSILSPGNDSLVTVALPFPVNFYGTSLQLLQVSDNGLVIFGPPAGASGRAPAECPGNALPPNNAIYVLASDWDLSLGGNLIVHGPDADTFVVTWRDVRRAGSSLAQSFQLVIGRASVFQGNYQRVDSPPPGIIGAENYDATFVQQVWCNNAGQQVKSGESVQFTARLPW